MNETLPLGPLEIDEADFAARFDSLLDEVERGVSFTVTRHGRPIARLEPDAGRRKAEVDAAVAAVKALRKNTGKMTVEEILAARHEGHKY